MNRIASCDNSGATGYEKKYFTSDPSIAPNEPPRTDLSCGRRISGLALTALLDQDNLLAAEPQRKRANPLASKASMFPAKAKSVIFLFMYGGVSHVDTFDPKPDLAKHHGKPMNKGKSTFSSAIPAI